MNILDSGSFREKFKEGRYYVFERHMIFRESENIYAAPHRRGKGKNQIQCFEEDFAHKCLFYECYLDIKLDLEEIAFIREQCASFEQGEIAHVKSGSCSVLEGGNPFDNAEMFFSFFPPIPILLDKKHK